MHGFLAAWIGTVAPMAVPYLLAALGLILSERAGVLSLGAEGLMLIGAVFGVGFTLSFGLDPYLATLAAMVMAALVSVIFAVMVVVLRINQIISGLALVFFCQGLSTLLGNVFGWSSRAIAGAQPFDLLPGHGILPAVLNQDLLVWLSVLLAIGVHLLLFHSGPGLRLRAVGESPEAADAAGLQVNRMRFLAILAGAALIGIAGAYMSVFNAKIWVDGMTGGRGWIAIALVIFARWRPLRALVGAAAFGAIEAAIPQIAAAGIHAPQYIIMMAPYAATLAAMLVMGIRGNIGDAEPAALGRPFLREER